MVSGYVDLKDICKHARVPEDKYKINLEERERGPTILFEGGKHKLYIMREIEKKKVNPYLLF